jgi:holdfast attachment protein HfaA
MRQSKLYHRTIAAFAGSLSVLAFTSAHAGMNGVNTSASFNDPWGMTSNSQMNAGIDPNIRDANGNLSIVNGLIGPANVSQQSGAGTTTAGAGNGSSGNASATAIGNNLSVQVQGSWNTVIVNSSQKNTGDQNATASLNGQLKL